MLGYLASWTTPETLQQKQQQEKESLIYPEPDEEDAGEEQKGEKVPLYRFRQLSSETDDDTEFVEFIKEVPLPEPGLERDQLQLNRLVEKKTIKDLIELNLNVSEEETNFKKEIPDKVWETIHKL